MTTRSGRVSATATAARVSTAAEDPLRCEAKYRRRCDQLHQSRMKGCHKKVSGSAAYKAQAHAIGASVNSRNAPSSPEDETLLRGLVPKPQVTIVKWSGQLAQIKTRSGKSDPAAYVSKDVVLRQSRPWELLEPQLLRLRPL